MVCSPIMSSAAVQSASSRNMKWTFSHTISDCDRVFLYRGTYDIPIFTSYTMSASSNSLHIGSNSWSKSSMEHPSSSVWYNDLGTRVLYTVIPLIIQWLRVCSQSLPNRTSSFQWSNKSMWTHLGQTQRQRVRTEHPDWAYSDLSKTSTIRHNRGGVAPLVLAVHLW